MIDLIPQIVDILSKQTYPVGNVIVRESYTGYKPDFNTPHVFVSEVSNTVNTATYTNSEQYSDVVLEIEIYSRTAMNGDTPVSAPRSCSLIRDIVDKAVSEQLCLFRVGNGLSQPSVFDNTVNRMVLTYNVTVNVKDGYCYKGVI